MDNNLFTLSQSHSCNIFLDCNALISNANNYSSCFQFTYFFPFDQNGLPYPKKLSRKAGGFAAYLYVSLIFKAYTPGYPSFWGLKLGLFCISRVGNGNKKCLACSVAPRYGNLLPTK
jgi:hypothetical protein